MIPSFGQTGLQGGNIYRRHRFLHALPQLKLISFYSNCAGVMLGQHVNETYKKGDLLVIGSLQIKEWRRERILESSFVTMVEVNPSQREGLDILQEIGEEEPKRKAMRLSLPAFARVKDALQSSKYLLQNAPTAEFMEFVLIGKLSPLGEELTDAVFVG